MSQHPVKLRFTESHSGRNGVFARGCTYDVPAGAAAEFIRAGIAVDETPDAPATDKPRKSKGE